LAVVASQDNSLGCCGFEIGARRVRGCLDGF